MARGTLSRGVQDRLPWPLGIYWVRAQQGRGPDGVFRSAEGVVRVLTALVLGDIIDAEWPDEFASILGGGPERRGLERPTFGTRIGILRQVVAVHCNQVGGVLPDLREWWSTVDGSSGPLQRLVEARNRVAHGAVTGSEGEADSKRREALMALLEVLLPAVFLRELQLVHVEGPVRVRRGRQEGLLRRLSGPAPYLTLATEADWPPGFTLEDNRVYMGSMDGKRWKLLPFYHLEPGDAASGGHPRSTVFDTVDRRGRTRFLEPVTGRDDIDAALPDESWRPVYWHTFLAARRTNAAGWSQTLSEPHPGFRFDAPAEFSQGLRAGMVIEGLRLVQQLGEGAAATVWEAEDEDDGHSYALKILKAEVVANEVDARRFEQEVATMKRLYRAGCRRVVGPVEAFRSTDGETRRLVVRMPLMSRTLKDAALSQRAAADGELGVSWLMFWLQQGLESLEELHRNGVVHRDIKPSNFLIDSDGNLFVSDLGVARDSGRREALTQTGDVVGTDIYMAPEQRVGSGSVGPAADIYALAVSFDELLHGAPRPVPGKKVAGPLGALLRDMGGTDADLRPSATDALNRLAAISADQMSEVLPSLPDGRGPAQSPLPSTSGPASVVRSAPLEAPRGAFSWRPEAKASPAAASDGDGGANQAAPAHEVRGRRTLRLAPRTLLFLGSVASVCLLGALWGAWTFGAWRTVGVPAEEPVLVVEHGVSTGDLVVQDGPTSLEAVPPPAPTVPPSRVSSSTKPRAVLEATTPVTPEVMEPTPVEPVVEEEVTVDGAAVRILVRPPVDAADFPASSSALGVTQGRCMVSLVVNPLGVPEAARASDCTPGFEEAIAAWAKRHRFMPPEGVTGKFRFEKELVMRLAR